MTARDRRLVEITCGAGTALSRGTGYVVSAGVVLTAAHVVVDSCDKPHEIRLRRAPDTGPEDWFSPTAVVLGGEATDAALLLFAAGHGEPSDVPPWVVHLDIDQPLPFHAPGFPRVQREGEERDIEVVRGLTAQGTTARRGALSLNIDSATPPGVPAARPGTAETDAAPSPWAGHSGAPVLTLGGSLVGMVVEHHQGFGGSRLEALAVTEIRDDPAFDGILPDAWSGSRLRPASSLVSFAIGDTRIRVDPPFQSLGEQERAMLQRSTALPLRARYRVVPFTGSDRGLAELARWCTGDTSSGHPAGSGSVGYALVSGAGGSGKSRLAAEVCRLALEAGLVAGTATEITGTAGTSGMAELTELGARALLVFDYVDYRAEFVATVLDDCRARGADVRLLVLARDGETFRRHLDAQLGLGMLKPDVDITLDDGDLTPELRSAHYTAAAAAYRRLHAPAQQRVELPASAAVDASPALDSCTTPLLVHARALLDVLGEAAGPDAEDDDPQTPVRTPGAEGVLAAVVHREARHFWAPATEGLGLGLETLHDLMAVTTLAGADTRLDALELLRAVPELADTSADRRTRVLNAVQGIYPGSAVVPLVEPDLLGEYLVATRLLLAGPLPEVFRRAAAPAQRSRMLEVLLRMGDSPFPAVRSAVAVAIRDRLDEVLPDLVVQADEAAARTGTPDERLLPARLAAALAITDVPSAAARAEERHPEFSTSSAVQPLAAILYRQAAAHWQAQGDEGRAVRLLSAASQALVRLNRPDAAFGLLDEATSVLSRTPDFSTSPQLGRILSTSALARLETGNHEWAISAARDAVGIARGAAEREPAVHQEQYTEALVSLLLAELSAADHTGALGTAVELVQAVAELGPQRRATALLLQCQVQLAGGDTEAAEQAMSTAEALLSELPDEAAPRELAAAQAALSLVLGASPDGLPAARDLARSALELADRLPDPGHEQSRLTRGTVRLQVAMVLEPDDGLQTVEEAHRLFVGLREEYPDIYEFYPTITALMRAELTAAQGDLGRAARLAQRAERDVAALYRVRPKQYYPWTAVAALTSASILSTAGRTGEAVASLEQAVQRFERLGAESALPLLARLRTARSVVLIDAGRHAEGAEAAREAVADYESLAERSGTWLPDLLGAHLVNMVGLVCCGQEEAARAAGDEAVRIVRRDAEEHDTPDTRRLLARVLAARGQWLREMRRFADALESFRESSRVYGTFRHTREDETDLMLLSVWTEECRAEIGTGTAMPGVADAPSLDSLTLDPASDAMTAAPSEAVSGAETEATPHNARWRIVLGRRGGKLVAAAPFRPVLVLGPQRSRKTTGVVIPSLLEWDGPALVTSVRTDVLAGTATRRRGMGDISVFEPTGRLHTHGEPTTTWNPLEVCDTWDGAVATARSLAETAQLTGDNRRQNDQFWTTMAEQLLQSLTFAAGATGQTMEKVSQWVKSMDSAEVRARLSVAGSAEAIRTFQGMRQLADVTLSSVYATAGTLLRAYDSAEVRARSVSGFQVDDFFNGAANTLYLCAPPEQQELMAPIFTALIRRVINEAYRRHEAGERTRLLLLLDEAGNIAKIENLDTLATTAAGTEIQLVTVFHDVAQVEALYGAQRAQSIINNHSAMLILPGNRDPRTGQLVRDLLTGEPVHALNRRPVRRLQPGTALCVYEHLPAEVIALRSATHDQDLLDIAALPGPGPRVPPAAPPSDSVTTLVLLAEKHAAAGRLEEALAAADRAVELAPDDTMARLRRSSTRLSAQRPGDAAADIDHVLANSPHAALELVLVAATLHRCAGEDEKALSGYARALEADPDNQEALIGRATVLYSNNQREQALADLDRVLHLAPENAEALAARGEIHRVAGRLEPALADLDHALRLEPDNAFALRGRADVHHLVGRYEEAVADFDGALRLERDNVFALTRRGESHRMAGRYEEAVADFDGALRLEPDNVFALSSRGELHRERGRLEEALTDLNHALRLEPEHAFALGVRGRVHRSAQRYAEARADLERALELSPGFQWVRRELNRVPRGSKKRRP
ncbi:type IV secretory system conjugative DNA transfer family protein [Streptomyces sp. NPDC048577]|uniref:type IV secretory system conjugative DNA transfer family protein n=1 Tax=Streptomyces sp. NPDC048577 TaxID=3157209 RepID=UPI00342119F6